MIRASFLSLVFAALLLSACGGATPAADSPPRWSKEVLEETALVPVLDAGRVKPLDTWASFTLLRMNNMRTCKDADGVRINHLEWALDALFRPGWARQHKCFLITTDEVLDAIGLDIPGRKKRDRYSFEELRPALTKLSEIAPQYLEKTAQERSPLEEGLVRLLLDAHDFTSLLRYMDFTRSSFEVAGSDELVAMAGGKRELDFSDVVEKGPALFAKFREMVPGDASPKDLADDARAINDLLGSALKLSKERNILRLFPPALPHDEEASWYTLEHLAEMGIVLGGIDDRHLSMLRDLEKISDAAVETEGVLAPLQSLRATSQELAAARGEYAQIEREVALYRLDPFNRSGYLFLLAFLAIAVTWLLGAPKRARWKRRLTGAAWVFLGSGIALLATGIVMRCIIRSRPPVTGLYDTIIFITLVTLVSCVIIELIGRKKLAFTLAPIVGTLGMFIAASYEAINRADTMPRLQAVLDTNFWLTLHVLCIGIGYAAALLAGFLGHLYVMRRFFQGRNAGRSYGSGASVGWTLLMAVLAFLTFQYFGSTLLGVIAAVGVGVVLFLHFRGDLLPTKKVDEAYFRDLARHVYGVTCFALLFCIVGTILGGVWANESWGRFWGWDPKENGALLICLCQLAMLHARMSGLVKAFGMSMAAVFTGMVTAFSWWGVNLLGIGLHSYGFTSGIWSALMLFYAVEVLVLGAGFHAWLRDRKPDPGVTSIRTVDVSTDAGVSVDS